MTIQLLVFYAFTTLAIVSAACVVTSKNSVRSVLFLVLTFFCTAVLWMLLESEFLAIALVLVYVGAVMVLFLFVVMMLDIEARKVTVSFVKYWPVGILVAGIMLALMILAIKTQFSFDDITPLSSHPSDYSNVKALASLLYTDYLLEFEMAGVILLIAMIAAIGLTFRGPRNTKTQKPFRQIEVRKSDRLTLLKMPSEQGGSE